MQNARIKEPGKGFNYYIQYCQKVAGFYKKLYGWNYADYLFAGFGGLEIACQRYNIYWNKRRIDGYIKKYIRFSMLHGLRSQKAFRKRNVKQNKYYNLYDLQIDIELIKKRLNKQDAIIFDLKLKGYTEQEIAKCFGKSRKIVKLAMEKIVYPRI